MSVSKYRSGTVVFRPHAIERLRERVPRAKIRSIQGRLRARIATELKKGIAVNSRGCLEVEIQPGVWAICEPSFWGGWEVVTFINNNLDKESDVAVEEKQEYQPAVNQAALAFERVKEMSIGIPDNEEYSAIQIQLTMIAGFIAEMKLKGFLERAHHADSIGHILNPTLYRDAMGGLNKIQRLAGAALTFQAKVHELLQEEAAGQ